MTETAEVEILFVHDWALNENVPTNFEDKESVVTTSDKKTFDYIKGVH